MMISDCDVHLTGEKMEGTRLVSLPLQIYHARHGLDGVVSLVCEHVQGLRSLLLPAAGSST